jgi:DNA-binding MarR family transcriptional regulator
MSERSDQTGQPVERSIADTCMGLHVRRASRILTQIYDAALQPFGLTLNQFTLLVAIRCFGAVEIMRLARELDTDQSTLSRNLKALERSGWSVISPGADRRTRRVSLTPAGEALLQKAIPQWQRTQAHLQERFGEEPWQSLLRLLAEVRSLRKDEGMAP